MKASPGPRRSALPPLTLALSALVTALVLLLLAVAPAASMPRILKRSVGSTESSTSIDAETTVKVCHSSTPCGWAVYQRFSRNVEYYVQNTSCECSRGRACIRAEDDLSVSAYVYRCSAEATTPQ